MALGLKASPTGFFAGSDSSTMLTDNSTMSSLASGLKSAAPVLAIAGAIQSAVGSYYTAQTQQYQIQSQASEKRYQLKAQQYDNESKLSTARYQASSQKTGLSAKLKETFYQLESNAINLETEASTAMFQSGISAMNARNAENNAQYILQSGQKEIAKLTLRAGKIKSAQTASMAARGLALGEGSTAEVIATTDFMKESDALTINANSVRASAAQRIQAANLEAQARMQGVAAESLQVQAREMTGIQKQMADAVYRATLSNVEFNEELAANVFRLSIDNASRSANMVTDFSGTISPIFNTATSLLGSAASLSRTWVQDQTMNALASKFRVGA
jgi:hypothetical protein